MDAIVLAAGFGTRLRPYTEKTPKPMLDVQGRPILDWALGALPQSIDRVLVVVNYLAEQIEAYLDKQTHVQEAVAVRQAVPRGTGDALRSCQEHLRSEKFLVVNGDDLYGADDLAKLAECDAGILAKEVQDPKKWGIAFLNEDGSLRELIEKPDVAGPQLANAGAYVFPGDVFKTELKESSRGEFEITDYVSAVAKEQRVEVIPTQFWLPIGTVETWQQAQKMDLATPLSRSSS